ncbi:MAG: hypothetical protein A2W17_06530 [Planctomycetes bacterium RBG_16_41_13]|nr:MAG: hypothetical protein A2W17_06530 [Planctomycetes bacterium RBG_16_41_13]
MCLHFKIYFYSVQGFTKYDLKSQIINLNALIYYVHLNPQIKGKKGQIFIIDKYFKRLGISIFL